MSVWSFSSIPSLTIFVCLHWPIKKALPCVTSHRCQVQVPQSVKDTAPRRVRRVFLVPLENVANSRSTFLKFSDFSNNNLIVIKKKLELRREKKMENGVSLIKVKFVVASPGKIFRSLLCSRNFWLMGQVSCPHVFSCSSPSIIYFI